MTTPTPPPDPDPSLTKSPFHATASHTSSSKDAADPNLAKPTSITSDLPIDHEHPLPTHTYAEESRVILKFDLRILPTLALMYLCNALDKGNLGNAKTDHMDTDLGFVGNQYSTMLSIFYVPYVVFAPPIAMLGKRFGPHRVLPILMVGFGSATLLSASVKNWGGMMALRWFLGMAESAFFPLVIYYLTTFYRRAELARRLAIFYAASNIANAFSGLLAFAVFHIESKLESWRYLFIIEGSFTILFAGVAYLLLPKSAYEAKFLTPEEKKIAFARIQTDSSSVVGEKFNLKDSLQIFKVPATYGFLLIEICLGVPLQSVSLFLPQIVQALGYDKIKTNLYTVAPNIVGACVLLILAFTSDGLRLRFPFIALGFALTCCGFIIYACIDVTSDLRIAYFACFMMTWGTSAPSVILSTWYNNNVAHEGRRVTLTSIGVPLANLMGVVSSNIFREQDKPKYLPALATTAAFGGLGCVLALSLGMWMMYDNKRRDVRQGVRLKASDVSTELLRDGPGREEFRWFL
jgi:MFS family permease